MKKISVLSLVVAMTFLCSTSAFAMFGGRGGSGGSGSGSGSYYPGQEGYDASSGYSQEQINQALNGNSVNGDQDSNENEANGMLNDNNPSDDTFELVEVTTDEVIADDGAILRDDQPGDRQPIPEPATIALIGTGLLGFAAARRKK